MRALAGEALSREYKRCMFKRLGKSQFATSFAGVLVWTYMAVLGRTIKWQVENEDAVRDLWVSNKPFIIASWHSRLLVMPAIHLQLTKRWSRDAGTTRTHKTSIIISNSKDGNITFRACGMMGLHQIRGSTARKDRPKYKGGVAGAREALRALKGGSMVCMTIDGPRGPSQIVPVEPIKLAQQAGVPIIAYGQASPAKRLGTWDRMMLPRPFAKGVIVFGEPIPTSKKDDSETLRASVEECLTRVNDQAEAMLAGEDVNLSAPQPATSDVQEEPTLERGGA